MSPETQVESNLTISLIQRMTNLNQDQALLVDQFLTQIMETHDPDVVATFLHWKDDPVIDTILLLTSRLDDECQYEVLDLAEELVAAA